MLPPGIRDPEYSIPGQASSGKANTDQTDEAHEETSGIYVRHAGLILLHPFLQYFLKISGCSVMKNLQVMNQKKQPYTWLIS